MESLWTAKAQGSQFIYFSNGFGPAHKSTVLYSSSLSWLQRKGGWSFQRCLIPYHAHHHWGCELGRKSRAPESENLPSCLDLSGEKVLGWASPSLLSATAGPFLHCKPPPELVQLKQHQPEPVVCCPRRPCGTDLSWVNAAKHSQTQWSGKNISKYKARDLASGFLLSSHWGRGMLSHKGPSQLKAFVQQHYSWVTFLFAPRGEYPEVNSLSCIPFAINMAVVIVILINLSLLLLHYQKGWVKRE